MARNIKIRGNWHHGVRGYFVDVRALDIFLITLPWMLAVDAIVRGWEYMRIGGFLVADFPSSLKTINGESIVNYQFFGITVLGSGVLLIVGVTLQRFLPIIISCMVGAATYLLLAGSFVLETFTGEGGTGLRSAITIFFVAFAWAFKGFFTATKKSISDIEREAEEQTKEFTDG